ncbi:MAG TPA: aromatic ring-hydroxylating dioxygenase subunit alpha [Mesorhizobium sp.]|jgi:Rieske 2Fe-2S family protein|nr:aromatic ring-hydroxylating dioxygenase subunit alpha [Mesorhizobium sp.]
MNERIPHHPASPLLDGCRPTLPPHAYFDPDWFAREQAAIWRKEWVCVGRAGDLPAMLLKRVSVGGENLVLLKDRDGKIACFHNTCRHRGAELCPGPERPLHGRLIACPYHQWSYDFSGRLVRTPFVSLGSDFRKEDHGLFPAHVREWNGFLFVCLADEPPDFGAMPDPAPSALDNWPMGELVVGHLMVKRLNCNWKIFWENYNECLHCPGIHPGLSEAVPIYAKGYMAPNEDPDWEPERAQSEPVLKPGRRTWTVDGRACGPEFADLTDAEREAGHTFVTLLPSVFVCAHVDYVRAVRVTPVGPEETELRVEWLFAPETLQAPGFDLANVVDFATTVLNEDSAACEMNQRGLRSSRYRGGTLMPQEFDLFRFHEWIRQRMAAPA